MRPKILFILHIPPPIDGAALMGHYVKESKLLNNHIEAEYINLTSAYTLHEIGKSSLAKVLIIFRIIKELWYTLRTNNYDACCMTLTAKGLGFYKDFLMVLLLKFYGANIIYHFHNKGVSENGKHWFNNLLYTLVFKNTHSILLAPSLYNDIKRYVAIDEISICNNGIPDIAPYKTIVQKSQTETKPFKFLFLSNMMEDKGVFVLLEACALLKKRNFKFTCDFIGAWLDITENTFNTKVKSLGLKQHINMHGKKYDTDKIAYFQNADVFVFPSYYHNECFPLVLLEAMQFSLPIISTYEGAIPEMVSEGETGLLIPQRDVSALASAMAYMLTHPEERERLGINGRQRYEERYTLGIFEKRMLEILQKSII